MMNSIQPLVYHRVCPDGEHFNSTYVVRASDFRKQIEYLMSNQYRAVTLDEFLSDGDPATRHPGKRVLLTFDDGYEDNYTHAFPVLREFGLPAVVFLVADFSRRTNWWDTPLGVPEARLLTPTQITRMAGNGIEFGSHTLTHRSLPGVSESELKAEVEGSRREIERVTGLAPRAFSYPYSHVDQRARRALREGGYQCAFAVNGGPFHANRDPWEIRRVNVTASARGLRLRAKLSGAEKFGLWMWWKARHRSGASIPMEIRRGF